MDSSGDVGEGVVPSVLTERHCVKLAVGEKTRHPSETSAADEGVRVRAKARRRHEPSAA